MLALAVGACDSIAVDEAELDPTNGEIATLSILLTDAPADYIAAAEVDIGRVELLPAGDGAPIVLSEDGTDGFVNLLDFQNAATMQLAEAEIEAGDYTQLRLIVEAARVGLIEGYAFRDGSTEKDLFVPSGAQTGIKLNLQGDEDMPLTIVPGETVLVLDFDVNQSFVLRGNPETPAGVHGVIFKPTLRVTGQDVAASISGVVSTALEGVSVEGLVVTAEPTDAGSVPGYQTLSGTAITDESGAYTIHFLVPGSYDVTVAVDEGLGTEPAMHSVELGYSEAATGADFEIIDVSGSIAGTVSTALEGASVEGLEVTATPDAEGMDPVAATTDAEGGYAIEGLLAGTYTVTVAVGEDQVTDPTAATVEVGPGEDVVGVDFEIVEDVSGSIAGSVTTVLEGYSVAGLEVTATPAEGDPVIVETDAEGAYLFESLVAGTYSVTVEAGAGFTTNPASLEVILAEDAEVIDVDFAVIAAS